MSTAGTSHSQSSKCPLQKLIPCYFALTSEPNPPQEMTKLAKDAGLPPLGQYYRYTLKLVQSGLLILTWGENENNVAAFYCDKGKFTQISDNVPGLSSGDHFVSVPECAGETFKVCYLHTLPEERDIAIASWKEIVKNLKKHEWQQITLCKEPYSLSLKKAVSLLEDFRREQGGWLDFLATWRESLPALNAEARKIFLKNNIELKNKEKWVAAEDDPFMTQATALSSGTPILLHDPVGQIHDCRKAYLLSLYTLHNFCRLHTPLLSGGFMALAGLVELKKQEQKRSKDRIQMLTTDFGLTMSKPESALTSPPSPPPFLMQSESALAEYQAKYRDWLTKPGAKAWAWNERAKCQEDFTYCPPYPLNAPKKALYSVMQEEFSKFKSEFLPYLQNYFLHHSTLLDGLNRITQTWIKLLSSSTHNSFQKLLATGLKYDKGVVEQIDDDFVDSLLLLRDAIFCRAHANIADIPSLPFFMDFSKDPFKELEKDFFPALEKKFPTLESAWEKIKKTQSDFLDDVRDALFTDEYLNFFCNTLSTGVYPTEAAGALLASILPLFVSASSDVAHRLHAALAKRMGLDTPQETTLTFMDVLCGFGLQSSSHFLTVEELLKSNPDTWSIFTKAINGIDALKNPFIDWIAERDQILKEKIKDLRKELYTNNQNMIKKLIDMHNTSIKIKNLCATMTPVYDNSKKAIIKAFDGNALLEKVNLLNQQSDEARKLASKNILAEKKIKIDYLEKNTLQSIRGGSCAIVGIALLLTNLRNLNAAIDALLTMPYSMGMTAYNMFSMATPVISIADMFKNILFSEPIARIVTKANIAASFISTAWEMSILMSNRNPGAAIGMGVMGFSSATLPLVLSSATLLSTVTLGIFGALGFLVGKVIYEAYKDSPLEEFLKNCLWNDHQYLLIEELRKLLIPYWCSIPSIPSWNETISITVKNFRTLYSLDPQISYDITDDILSISFVAPCGNGAHFDYEISLSYIEYGGRTVMLEANDLIDTPYLEVNSGIFSFKARYHIQEKMHYLVNQAFIFAYMMPPTGREHPLTKDNILLISDRITINVTIHYSISSDIDYGTTKKHEKLTTIIQKSTSSSPAI